MKSDYATEKQSWSPKNGRDYIRSENFLRNSFPPWNKQDKYGIPFVYKQKEIDLSNVQFIGFQNTKLDDKANTDKTVHFYLFDNKFNSVWNTPYKSLLKLKQYKQVVSPDYSLFTDMPVAIQIQYTFRRRWVSAFWQSKGLVVIPAITWGDERSFEFCFDGIQEGAIVAVSTLWTHNHKEAYMKGFTQMIKKIKPEKVVCYCAPYMEMLSMVDITAIPYEAQQKSEKKAWLLSGQKELFA